MIEENIYSLKESLIPLKNVWVNLYGIPHTRILIEYTIPDIPKKAIIFPINLIGREYQTVIL